MNSEVLYTEVCKNKQGHYTRKEIEERVRNIQRVIWNDRDKIWFDDVPSNPVKMLDPLIAARLLGFQSEESSSLGHHRTLNGSFEVAGLIDNKLKKIQISLLYPIEVRNFTAAHELGHAVLHRENGLHRDKPMDGTNRSRDETEYEADLFATVFLMPENILRTRFKEVFLTDNFVLNEDTAFALGYASSVFTNRLKTRQLSRILASTEKYNNRHIDSLAKQFNVSIEAMAIRLEELGLVN